jgi:hypothetical protein
MRARRCLRISGSIMPIVVFAAVLGAATTASARLKKAATLSPGQQGALLRPPAEPDCTFKPPVGLNPSDARLMRLEFEQQCYKLADMAIRNQLTLLKAALRRTGKPDAEPDCALGSVPAGISEKDARIMRLDYEAQCYRQTADIRRARLSKLQASVITKAKSAAISKTRTSSRKRSNRPPRQRKIAERFQAQGR